MKACLLVSLILFAGCIGKKQANIDDEMRKMYEGRRSWPYFKLSENTKGVILSDVLTAGCGYVITASISVIKTDKKDTIRVLELCNSSKKFNIGDSVIIAPTENNVRQFIGKGESFILNVTLGVDSLYDYRHYKTCFGTVSKR